MRTVTYTGLVFVALLCCGCSVQKLAVNAISDALSAEGSLVFTGEEDPVLVGQSLPTILKVYESLLESQPDNRALLLSTARAFTLYAFGFVQTPADMMPKGERRTREHARAKALYRRARDYLFHALELQYPDFGTLAKKGKADSLLAQATLGDAPLLYWAGVSWMGQLTAGAPGLTAAFNLRKAAELLQCVDQLDSTFERGAVHEVLITYYGMLPTSMGGSVDEARARFDKAVRLSNGARVRPYVSMADVAAKAGDRTLFESSLHSALKVDTDTRTADRLVNVLNQQRARWMLDRIETYFPEESEPQ